MGGGGGSTGSDSIFGGRGAEDTLLTLDIILKILGGARDPPASLLRGPCSVAVNSKYEPVMTEAQTETEGLNVSVSALAASVPPIFFFL